MISHTEKKARTECCADPPEGISAEAVDDGIEKVVVEEVSREEKQEGGRGRES